MDEKPLTKKTNYKKRKRNIVEAIIINAKGEIFLQKKTINYPYGGGIWTFFGGEIELGETPKQTLRREVKEETNYDITDFKLLFSKKYELFDCKGIEYIFIINYKGELSDISITEGAGFAFFDKSELDFLKIPEMARNALNRYLNSIR